ncbi:hypothetical protein GCM10029992_36650 [Glycomyces albus]
MFPDSMNDKIDCEKFEAAIDAIVPEYDLEIETAYLGRRSYGRTCVGVTGTFGALARFLFELGRIAEQDDDHVLEDVVADTELDALGTSLIVYFPGWRLDQSTSDE